MKRELEHVWRTAFGEYEARKQAAEAQVVRWEWTLLPRYTIRPLFFERYPGRGKVLKTEPEDKSRGAYEYGFDAQDRVVVERVYNYTGEPFERFVRWIDAQVEQVRYGNFQPKLPLEVGQLRLPEGRAAAFGSFTINIGPQLNRHQPDAILELLRQTHGIIQLGETYQYNAQGRIDSIDYWQEAGPHANFRSQETVIYNTGGQIERIEAQRERGERVTLYQRPPKNENVRSLGESLKNKLLEAIPQIWASAGKTETLYCMVLYYRAFYFPPVIIPGYERDRQALLHSDDPTQRYFIWTPVGDEKDMEPLQIQDTDMLELCRLYEQEVAVKQQWLAPLKLLRQIGKALTAMEWSGKLPVTDDFVVYAMDYEADELENCLEASVSKSQMKKWQEQELLP
jgi:hypothetical protein